MSRTHFQGSQALATLIFTNEDHFRKLEEIAQEVSTKISVGIFTERSIEMNSTQNTRYIPQTKCFVSFCVF